MNKDEVVRVLEDAAGIVDSGWCQRTKLDAEGNVCAAGAINRASSGSAITYTTSSLAALGEFNERVEYSCPEDHIHGTSYGKVACWNDAPERTASEVSELLRKTAKDLANGDS